MAKGKKSGLEKEKEEPKIFYFFAEEKKNFSEIMQAVFQDYLKVNLRKGENVVVSKETFKVGMYIRLSREDGDKGESESIGNQRKILQRYIRENQLELVQEYIDDGVSGTIFNRPGFNQMLKDIEMKKINMVITKDLSRLGRDYIKTGYYIENYFPEKKIRYVAVNDNIDTYLESNCNDITPFKAILNDMYAKDISKKIRSVFKEKQKNGEYMCSIPAYRLSKKSFQEEYP